MDLTVVIPALNEAARLPGTLEQIVEFLIGRGDEFEIVVIDDGSIDGSGVAALSTFLPGLVVETWNRHRGKGAAIRRGIELSRGRRILLCHADLAIPIDQLPVLEAALSRAPLVYGSRAVGDSRVTRRQPLVRGAMGRAFHLLVRLLGLRRPTGTECGFKLLEGELGRDLASETSIEGFAWDVELTWIARQRGLAIEEVGVEWRHRDGSKGPRTSGSWRTLVDVVRLRRRLGPPGPR